MENKYRIIDFNKCEIKRMRERGLGGVRLLVRETSGATYIVKPESLTQTLNEVMGQIILNSIGQCSIDYAFVLIDGTYYGALKYFEGLTRIGRKNYKILSKKQKGEFLKHLFLNAFLDNEDINGEIYLTKDGKVVSLDYGEAGVRIPLFNLHKKNDFEKSVIMSAFHKKSEMYDFMSSIRAYISVVSKFYIDDSVGIDDIKQVMTNVIDGFINADYSEYETFLKELMALQSELHVFIYQEHLNGLIEAAEELKANLNKLFDDMPA